MSGYRKVDGEKLRAARESAMLSQLDLSRATGVAQATISHLERGDRTAQPKTVRKLAEALGVVPKLLVRKPKDG